ncbi:MAG: hypothetical protein LDLANPLL_00740 [Turneriella sp.]|nr:hypothetical protein [Turneriella sp.]
MIKARDNYTIESLKELWEKEFSDLPFEAVVKQDILRQGMVFTASALNVAEYKKKDYFIFTFDRAPLKDIPEHTRAPEEIRIFTDDKTPGVTKILPTVISVRLNPTSPYKLDADGEGNVKLYLADEAIANAIYPPIPAYYKEKYSFGSPIGEVAPAIEWGYLIYLTVFRNCQYFGKDEECQFCDINHNWRQQKREGRPYTGVKNPEHVVEALERIAATDSVAKAFTITGGSVTGKLGGKDEVEFYLQFPRKISASLKEHFISKLVIQAWELDDCKKAVDAGVKIYHPNYEVWDVELFKKVCPGKERYIGRDNWIRRVVQSAEAFGAKYVIPNFVGGVEMADNVGFTDIDKAVESTSEGLDFFMSKGIIPRFTTWCPEPFTPLGETSAPAPLLYYLKLLRSYKAIHKKYALEVPPGYGDAGVGKAVFSVSAFMDVL